MDNPVIHIQGLRKNFRSREALKGIDLDVDEGTILGYIGPNGAGKTTTIKILAGLQDGFRGEVRVMGFDPRTDSVRIRASVGYVPESAALYGSLTAAEFLLFVGRLHGLKDETIRIRADALLAAFDLQNRMNSRISTLSRGMRQKLLISTALLHSPRVLLLDEPLIGLDARSALLVETLLRRLAEEGRTILYCTHALDVVERLCDRVAIVDDGSLVADRPFAEIATESGGDTLQNVLLAMSDRDQHAQTIQRVLSALACADG